MNGNNFKETGYFKQKTSLISEKITLRLEGTLDLKLSPCSLVTEEKKFTIPSKCFPFFRLLLWKKWFKIA